MLQVTTSSARPWYSCSSVPQCQLYTYSMPLHLLGKKSWNVYNPAAIARVRQDEADAQAREEAAEQRMQEQDAERRIALLRGEIPPALPEPEPEEEHTGKRRREHAEGRQRKRRRLRGEDETDMEMRLAREDVEAASSARQKLDMRDGGRKSKRDGSPHLVDGEGHIQLFSEPRERDGRKGSGKDDEAEDKRVRKQQREQDKVTMRFSNAAGYGKGTQKLWYAAGERGKPAASAMPLADVQEMDVWGNEDPRRKEREQNRISSSDPFAAMQMAQRQLKQSEREREKWKAERDRDLLEFKKEEDRRRRRRRRREEGSEDGLDGFSLDAPAVDREQRHAHRKRHEHRSEHGKDRRHRPSRSDSYQAPTPGLEGIPRAASTKPFGR